MFERPHIRTATVADAEPLVALAERTFRDTFADDNSTDDMDAYVRDAFSLDRVRAELAADVNTFLLAFMDDKAQPDGYVKLRNATTNSSVTGPDPVELQRLYVDRSAMGQGVESVSSFRRRQRLQSVLSGRAGPRCTFTQRSRFVTQ